MTKHLPLIFVALCAIFSCEEKPATPGDVGNPPTYKKSDFQKLRWVEGNWKTDVSGPGYYQIFHFPTDSTLDIISYQFDGKDTSSTTISTVYWRNNHIYLGPNGEWVAVLLDKKSFQLEPVRRGWNSIIWTQKNKDEWTSVQRKPEFVRTINMKRQPPLEKLLNQ